MTKVKAFLSNCPDLLSNYFRMETVTNRKTDLIHPLALSDPHPAVHLKAFLALAHRTPSIPTQGAPKGRGKAAYGGAK
jgi:hypothetical protein